ncbi:MAG: DNA mismatch repair protein MutH, partial [Thaumarchaeota archaeon]|nr:DNA mismatch repair protein MutH [Nitrososphaerota archaeon]
FKAKYVEDGLGSVSQALLGETKIGGDIKEMTQYKLAHYCYNDSRLTYKLSSYNNNLVMNLLVIISRISNNSIDECSRYAISHWILSLLYYTHRQNNELIPKSDDFPQKDASTKSVGDKKYEGAIVLEPVAGVHFDVKVMDFASLYPSIIKVNNVSYETVNCSHAECEANKVPFTTHWICTKKTGIVSSVIGSLKELRVGHFKKLSKTAKTDDEKSRYETISEALKVFLNASYGVIGYETFPLYYLPTAEAVTAYGRNTITETVNTAKDFEMNVIYGDTDSIFLKSPTQEQISNLIAYAKQAFNIDLEQDKTYRYVVLSNRRKNYFGIKSDGTVDIKGLTGKKSSTPPFIRESFTRIMDRLKTVNNPSDFALTSDFIRTEIRNLVDSFDTIPFEKLSFKVLVKEDPSEYKVKPAAVKAAELLGKVTKGQFVEYIKVRGTKAGVKVKPVQLVQRKEIDKEKYMEILETTMSQIVEPMDLDIEELMGKGKQLKMGDFW